MPCISPVFLKSQGMPVPCGKCGLCRQHARNGWTFRVQQEQKHAYTSKFLTLTYDEENLPQDGNLNKKHLQAFINHLRKAQDRFKQKVVQTYSPDKIMQHARISNDLNAKSIRYYAVGEYGGLFGRPHYHIIIFNLLPDILIKAQKIWGKGMVDVGEVETASIHYVTGYVISRINADPDKTKPFTLISNRSGGIGHQYLTTSVKNRFIKSLDRFVISNGEKWPMPRYYQMKIDQENPKSKAYKEIKRAEQVRLADERYNAEIIRLSKFHNDPEYYYEQVQEQKNNKVLLKLQK